MRKLISTTIAAILTISLFAFPANAGHYHHENKRGDEAVAAILGLGFVAIGTGLVINSLNDKHDRRRPPTHPSGGYHHQPGELIGPVDDCHWQPIGYDRHVLVCG